MPAFKKLGPGDQIDNVLVLEPQWTLASGSGGWRGSPEGSASVNLYGGAHRRQGGVVREYRYEPTIPGIETYGQLRRSNPITASVDYVYLTNEDLNLAQRSRTRWGYEHWKTVSGLYGYYSRRDSDYVTSSYDHYCLLFQSGSRNMVASSGSQIVPTGSFTLESWVKPFVTSSVSRDFTVQSRTGMFWFGVTGSTGRLVLSSSAGGVTSSVGPSVGLWSHIAVSYDATTQTGTFYLNLSEVGRFGMPALSQGVPTALYTIGNRIEGSGTQGSWSVGSDLAAFQGLLGETRAWGQSLTWARLSGTAGSRLTAASGALSCYDLSDGPLSQVGVFAVGSGALDAARQQRGETYQFAQLVGFDDRPGPGWHPSDNPTFVVPKQFATGTVQRMRVIAVPSAMYGRQISPGSVRLTCRAFSSYGLVRTLVDDGRGGLYISGSVCGTGPEAGSVGWNKVGNVFYSEGLILIKDPSLLDFGDLSAGKSATPSDVLQLDFRGHSRVPVKTVISRIDRGELNRSLNPTYYNVEEDGHRSIRHPSGNLYVTTVGLYNSDRELVGVARLAEPLRVRPRDRLAIKIRMDF